MLSLDHCPKCQSNHIVKAGFASGKQRYRCKDCIHHFTVLRKSTKKDDKVKRMAVDMYLEGLGFRAIGRVLGISYGTVYQWIKQLGTAHQNTYNTNLHSDQDDEAIDIVELDEIHSYTKHKKTTVGLGLPLTETPNKS